MYKIAVHNAKGEVMEEFKTFRGIYRASHYLRYIMRKYPPILIPAMEGKEINVAVL